MTVLVEVEVSKCGDCPHIKYNGVCYDEDVYECRKTEMEVSYDTLSRICPFIESTLDKLFNKKD